MTLSLCTLLVSEPNRSLYKLSVGFISTVAISTLHIISFMSQHSPLITEISTTTSGGLGLTLFRALWKRRDRIRNPTNKDHWHGECTVTESPNFFKLCEIKVSLCSKKMTKPYDLLFRNTRENRDNTREKIFKIYNVPYL